MAELLSPGVYVNEVPAAIQSITGVSTSTAGFIGVVPDEINLATRDATTGSAKLVTFSVPTPAGTAVPITNFSQFAAAFGDFLGKPDGEAAGSGAEVDANHRHLAHAVYGFFNNGGSRCFVVRVTSDTEIGLGLDALDAIDEVAIVCAPGQLKDAARDLIVSRCRATQDRFAILDGPEIVTDLLKLTRPSTDSAGVGPNKTDYAAFYYPWLKVFDPATDLRTPGSGGVISVPPSGHLAGVYARVDTERGFFKSPANEVVRGALGLSHPLSKPQQDLLNPKGVNCIRALNGNIYVWGARTVGGDSNGALKYISVRRTLLFLRESIDEGLQWAVFEPNTPALWAKITRNITAFLTTVWRSGALFGTTPQEAFFVKCDAETNPDELREQGQVVTQVGVAIARPAEFVIFNVSQFTK